MGRRSGGGGPLPGEYAHGERREPVASHRRPPPPPAAAAESSLDTPVRPRPARRGSPAPHRGRRDERRCERRREGGIRGRRGGVGACRARVLAAAGPGSARPDGQPPAAAAGRSDDLLAQSTLARPRDRADRGRRDRRSGRDRADRQLARELPRARARAPHDYGCAPRTARTHHSHEHLGGTHPSESSAPAVSPAETQVAVLNGTSTPKLAHRLSASLQQSGYSQATPLNGTPPGSHQTTVVEYSSGHHAEAAQVAQALGVTQVQPMEAVRVPARGELDRRRDRRPGQGGDGGEASSSGAGGEASSGGSAAERLRDRLRAELAPADARLTV